MSLLINRTRLLQWKLDRTSETGRYGNYIWKLKSTILFDDYEPEKPKFLFRNGKTIPLNEEAFDIIIKMERLKKQKTI